MIFVEKCSFVFYLDSFSFSASSRIWFTVFVHLAHYYIYVSSFDLASLLRIIRQRSLLRFVKYPCRLYPP
ncbi:hypothetical protein K435DRAFT_51856 [Dendrothele bispora CBS 962.96]|uniref:Uncharacterized protein n=1 Tax=Dendrothele bispora (strain CBS 962.96) TaxID=1314807 RepID=A0A4S8KSE1_DENBC|nr:hypothetical protein K435DRAFT_51856 [Dendrothele bispora CBS 962.96]